MMESMMSSINGPKEDYAVRLKKELGKTGIYARMPMNIEILF